MAARSHSLSRDADPGQDKTGMAKTAAVVTAHSDQEGEHEAHQLTLDSRRDGVDPLGAEPEAYPGLARSGRRVCFATPARA
jgi:hypothetical protein